MDTKAIHHKTGQGVCQNGSQCAAHGHKHLGAHFFVGPDDIIDEKDGADAVKAIAEKAGRCGDENACDIARKKDYQGFCKITCECRREQGPGTHAPQQPGSEQHARHFTAHLEKQRQAKITLGPAGGKYDAWQEQLGIGLPGVHQDAGQKEQLQHLIGAQKMAEAGLP